MKVKTAGEWFLWIIFSVILYLIGIGVPFLSPLVLLAAPAPIMIVVRSRGFREGFLGALFGTLLVYIAVGPVSAFLYTCEFGLLGLMMGILLIKTKDGSDYMLLAILASIAVKLMLMGAFRHALGVNPFMITPENAKEITEAATSALSRGGLSISDSAVDGYIETMITTVSLLMPSMVVLYAAADSMASYLLACSYLKKRGIEDLPALPPFGEWRFPKNIFWALFAALALDVAFKTFPSAEVCRNLSVNLMEILRAIFLIEGIAVGWNFAGQYGIKLPFKAILAAFCVFFPPLSYAVSLLGIFDIWYNLRKRIKLRRK